MDSDKLLNLATSLGCLLAESGAEISRVEESVYRLLQAYQGKDAQVFAIPSCLIVSLRASDGHPVTRMRRIPPHGTDIELLERCNELCRTLCRTVPPLEQAQEQAQRLTGTPGLPACADFAGLCAGPGIFYAAVRRRRAGRSVCPAVRPGSGRMPAVWLPLAGQ